MALAIYRKYRPQIFSDLTGQVHVRVTLQNEIATEKIAHAYLFAGPRGIGKTTTARIFAKSINCTDLKENEACRKCDACKSIEENRAVDIIEIDAASHTGVDNVRENIIENARFTPTALKYKVFIIDEVHMLSTAAFNALLKTLEEPPDHTVFILATTETHKVPATIISRCQRFDFHKIAVPEIVSRLAGIAAKEEVEVDKEVFTAVARAAGGSVRDAESLLGQVFAIGEKHITVDSAALVLPHSDLGLAREFLKAIDQGQGGEALKLIDQLINEGVDLDRFTADCLQLMRLSMRVALGESSFLVDYDDETTNHIQQMANWPLAQLSTGIVSLMEAATRVKHGDGSPLPLELVVVELMTIHQVAASLEKQPDEQDQPKPPEPPPPKAPTSSDEQNPPDNSSSKEDKAKGETKILSTSIESIRKKWQDVISNVGEARHSLAYIMNGSKPERLEGGILYVGVPFAFHRERLNETKNRLIIESACEKVFKEVMGVESVVVEGLANPNSDVEPVSTDDPVVKNVLDAFGGRVVS